MEATTKPWAEMTPYEQDVALARLLGYTVYHYDKDVYRNCYYCLMTPSYHAVLPFREGERRTEVEAWNDAPSCTSLDTACLVEDEIERRNQSWGMKGDGPRTLYLIALSGIVGAHPGTESGLWTLLRATPEQRCEAAWLAMGGK